VLPFNVQTMSAGTNAGMIVPEDASPGWPLQAPDRAAEALEAFWGRRG
jgi:hypothetical protein